MRALRPLRHREFRLLWSGLAVSLVGDGLWLVAIAWQVIELGGGPVQLSIVTTLFAVGLVSCVLLGGVVADRVSRRRVMLAADVVRGVATLSLGLLAVTGALELWHLAVGGFAIGAAEAFFVPAFTALVPQLLPADELLAANGLEGVVRPLAVQSAGPALGGLLVAASDPGVAMLVNAGTYVASVGFLLAMRPVPAPEGPGAGVVAGPAVVAASGLPAGAARPVPTGPPAGAGRSAGLRSVVSEMAEGARYVRSQRWLWSTLLFAMVAILFLLGPLEVLLPFAVRDQTGGGSSEYGLLLAVYGVSSALGALAISSRPLPRRYMTAMLVGWGLGTLPIAAIGFLDALWAMALVLVVTGACDAVGQVVWGTLLQRRVPARLQGRVASLDWFVSLGLLPVSMALAGPAGELVGVTAVFVVAGVMTAVSGLGVLFVLGLRRDELEHPLDDPA
ncbi:MFS transporter [Patulibacter minatonensis]|uniref:MFS transporter n=1 Tax=Patulibacter minatonensis TaxID=298163 RepID=UPI000A02ED1A|nr:MFS transporter [Patulibacter minatonensis]